MTTNCEIITIGDELLIGQVINTNVSWIAQKLSILGIDIIRTITIGDNEKDIIQALNDSQNNADITIVTGGLGPTNDDITKKCACQFFNCKLIFNEDAFNNIVTMFKARDYKLTESNRQQAMLPEKCQGLHNSFGTAPGMFFSEVINDKTKVFIFLPGVPTEMKGLMDEQVIPKLKELYDISGVYFRTVLTQGLGESYIAEIIKEWEDNLPSNIKLAYLPQYGSVRLRITAYGDDYDSNKSIVEHETVKLVSLIPELVYGYDDDTLEHAVGQQLIKHNMTISSAESCTGGNIAHLLTSVAGSSDYFKGSIVSYANSIKNNVLGVNNETIETFGAVSKETVEEMAIRAKEIMNTDIAIATSGIAGPGGGSETKPVGSVWIALAHNNDVISKLYHFGNNREINITRASQTALKMVFDYLIIR